MNPQLQHSVKSSSDSHMLYLIMVLDENTVWRFVELGVPKDALEKKKFAPWWNPAVDPRHHIECTYFPFRLPFRIGLLGRIQTDPASTIDIEPKETLPLWPKS